MSLRVFDDVSLTFAQHPLKIVAATTAMFAAVSGVYTASEGIVQNIRGKKDIGNGAIAGCAAGSLIGLRKGSVQMVAGGCASFAVVSAFLETFGGLGSVHNRTEQRRKAVYASTTPAVAEDK